jgi:hypothetical protein
MANVVFNISKGRVAEFYNRVDTNDPSGCELVVMVINAGAATDDTIRGYDTFSTLIGDANVIEVTNTGYARKILVGADLAAFAPDDVNDRVDLDIPDQTWTSVSSGDVWTDIVIGYDPAGTGVDTNIIPMTLHDFSVTPDGSNITAQIDAAGFFRAS